MDGALVGKLPAHDSQADAVVEGGWEDVLGDAEHGDLEDDVKDLDCVSGGSARLSRKKLTNVGRVKRTDDDGQARFDCTLVIPVQIPHAGQGGIPHQSRDNEQNSHD